MWPEQCSPCCQIPRSAVQASALSEYTVRTPHLLLFPLSSDEGDQTKSPRRPKSCLSMERYHIGSTSFRHSAASVRMALE